MENLNLLQIAYLFVVLVFFILSMIDIEIDRTHRTKSREHRTSTSKNTK